MGLHRDHNYKHMVALACNWCSSSGLLCRQTPLPSCPAVTLVLIPCWAFHGGKELRENTPFFLYICWKGRKNGMRGESFVLFKTSRIFSVVGLYWDRTHDHSVNISYRLSATMFPSWSFISLQCPSSILSIHSWEWNQFTFDGAAYPGQRTCCGKPFSAHGSDILKLFPPSTGISLREGGMSLVAISIRALTIFIVFKILGEGGVHGGGGGYT